MLQTGRKLPLSMNVEKPVHKCSSLPDTSFSASFTLHSDEDSEIDLHDDDSPSSTDDGEHCGLGTYLIAQEAAHVAAKTSLMTKLEEKMCDNIESTSSPDVALLSTSAPVMLMSPLENFLADDIQSFSWSESSSEHKSPSTDSPRTKKASKIQRENTSGKNSPLVSPGRRSLRSSGSNTSVHRRTGSLERISKGSYGKLNRSPSDEIFPMEMTESYDKDDVLLVTRSGSLTNSRERIECKVDVHNRSCDEVPVDVCTEGLYRQRSNSYQSALSEAGSVSVEPVRDLKTPDSLTQTPQLDSDLDLTNIIDKIFTFSSSVSRDTASSEMLSSMVSSETQSSRDMSTDPDLKLETPDLDTHPLRKSKSYERAISDEYDGSAEIVEESSESHILDTVVEEKSRSPSTEKETDKRSSQCYSQPTAPPGVLPLKSPVSDDVMRGDEWLSQQKPEFCTDSPAASSDLNPNNFIEQKTPYIHIVERVTTNTVVNVEASDDDTEPMNAIVTVVPAYSDKLTDTEQFDSVVEGESDSQLPTNLRSSSCNSYDRLNFGESHRSSVHDDVADTRKGLESEHSSDLLRNEAEKLVASTPDNISLSPSEDEHYQLMYSLASTPSLGTLCSQLDIQNDTNDDLDRSDSTRDLVSDLALPPYGAFVPDIPAIQTDTRRIDGMDLRPVRVPTPPQNDNFIISYGAREHTSPGRSSRGRSPDTLLDTRLIKSCDELDDSRSISSEKLNTSSCSSVEKLDSYPNMPICMAHANVDRSRSSLTRSHEMLDLCHLDGELKRSHEMVDIAAQLGEPMDRSSVCDVAESHEIFSTSSHCSTKEDIDVKNTSDDVFISDDASSNYMIRPLESFTSGGGDAIEGGLTGVPVGANPSSDRGVAGSGSSSDGGGVATRQEWNKSRSVDVVETGISSAVAFGECLTSKDSPVVGSFVHSGAQRPSPSSDSYLLESPSSQRGQSAEITKIESPPIQLKETTNIKAEDAKRNPPVTESNSRSTTKPFGPRIDNLEESLEKLSSDISSKRTEPPKRNTSGIAAKFESICSLKTDVPESSVKPADNSKVTETEKVLEVASHGDSVVTPVKRKQSVRELTSRFESDSDHERTSVSPARDVKDQPRSGTEDRYRNYGRQVSVEKSPPVLDKTTPLTCRLNKSSFPVTADKAERALPCTMRVSPDIPVDKPSLSKRPLSESSSASHFVSRPQLRLSDTPKWTPQWTPRKEQTVSNSPDRPHAARTVSTEPLPERSRLAQKRSPEHSPERPRLVEKRSPEHSAEPHGFVQKRSPEHSPECEEIPSTPASRRDMPMLSNRFSDRPDLFAVAAKYREPTYPDTVPGKRPQPKTEVTDSSSWGGRQLLDKRRSLKSPNEEGKVPFWIDTNRVDETELEVPSSRSSAPPLSQKTLTRRQDGTAPRLGSERRLSNDPMNTSSSSVDKSRQDSARPDERRTSLTSGFKQFSLNDDSPVSKASESVQSSTDEPSSTAASLFGVTLRKTNKLPSSVGGSDRASCENAGGGSLDHRQSGDFRQSWVASS